MWNGGFDYFTDFWNTIDILSLIFNYNFLMTFYIDIIFEVKYLDLGRCSSCGLKSSTGSDCSTLSNTISNSSSRPSWTEDASL